jgi:DNA-binding NtrC family response regulator
MDAAKRRAILIIELAQLREEIFNLLLSAGYEEVTTADSLTTAIDMIRQSAYDTAVADPGPALTAGMQFAADLADISPSIRIIFMINAEDQRLWDQIASQSDNVRFLIKTDFARNLLYLLEENAQP